jgi:hypothetical protein
MSNTMPPGFTIEMTTAALCLSCALPACVYDSPTSNPLTCPIESAKLATIALTQRIGPGLRQCPCGYVGPLKRDFLSKDGYITRRCLRCRLAKRRRQEAHR